MLSSMGPKQAVAKASRASRLGARASRSFSARAVIERTYSGSTSVTAAAEPELVVAPEFDLLPSSPSHDSDFAAYSNATKRLETLELLSAELFANLQDINALNSAADAIGTLESPTFQFEQEERRAKRAAAREARKVKVAASSAPAPASAPTASGRAESATATRERLEGLLRRSPASMPAPEQPGPRTASSSAATASTTSALVAQRPSTSAATGPSLLPMAPSATGFQAEPSTRAREANARRARATQGRRGGATAAHALAQDMDAQPQKMGSASLLSGDKVKELTLVVKDLLYLKKVKAELQKALKRKPTSAEWARAVNMDVSSFEDRLEVGEYGKKMMINANYRLVVSVANRLMSKASTMGVSKEDLVAEGLQGLIKGVEKFDGTKGFRFSTYAHWWIRQAMMRGLTDQGRMVRMPSHLYEIFMRIQALRSELDTEGHQMSMAEMSKRLDVPVERIVEVLNMAKHAGSLDEPMGGSEGVDKKDMLADGGETPSDHLGESMLHKDMDCLILAELSKRDAEVMKMRWGLQGERASTFEEIGNLFKLSRERIRQIEVKALRTLRQKHHKLAGLLEEYKNAAAEHEVVGRRSQGTNKQR